MAAQISKLFQPMKVGRLSLQHRIVMPPMTRLRASESGVPIVPLVKEYYRQRSCSPGTLLIGEAAYIAPKAGGIKYGAGIWANEQLAAWKEVTDGVHNSGSFIFTQLHALGRAADESLLTPRGLPYVSASDVRLEERPNPPRALTREEIAEYVELYAVAAKNAVEVAGFDGVELHAGNGYLVDQFLQDVSNKRTDEYGGNIENRSRFALDVVDALVESVGADRVGIRISPWSTFQGMKMDDPIPQFSHLVTELKYRHPKLAYLHAIEARIHGITFFEPKQEQNNDFLRKIWSPSSFISTGGHTRDSAIALAESQGDLVGIGRMFISNPDLVRKMQENILLTPYDRSTFYCPGPKGYIDYPTHFHAKSRL